MIILNCPDVFPVKNLLLPKQCLHWLQEDVYDMPSDSMRLWPPDSKGPFTKGNKDMTVSAYDNAYAYWGSSHEEGWKAVKKNDFMSGLFVWSWF